MEYHLVPFSPHSNASTYSSRLIIFVGPSGSGKDTLMVRVRDQILSEDLNVHIAQRWITRENDETEQFHSLTRDEFQTAVNNNTFVVDWEIYGNCYGVPRSEIDPFLEQGVVLLNLSRKELGKIKALYPKCRVVLVEVATELAQERIKQRKRDQGEMLDARIQRLHQKINLPFIPDLIIKNNSFAINSVIVILAQFLKACLY